MSDQFDPIPNKPYGKCNDCGLIINTEQDRRDHMRETRGQIKMNRESASHGIIIHNPPRARRIQRGVEAIVEEAIHIAMSDLEDLGLTDEEISDALTGHPEFKDAWEER